MPITRNGIRKVLGGYELTHDGRSWFFKTRVCAESYRATLIDIKKRKAKQAATEALAP